MNRAVSDTWKILYLEYKSEMNNLKSHWPGTHKDKHTQGQVFKLNTTRANKNLTVGLVDPAWLVRIDGSHR